MLNRMMTVGNRWTKGNKETPTMMTIEEEKGTIREGIPCRECGKETMHTLGGQPICPQCAEDITGVTAKTEENAEKINNEAESPATEFDDLLDLDGKTHMVDGEELTTSQLAKKYSPDNYSDGCTEGDLTYGEFDAKIEVIK